MTDMMAVRVALLRNCVDILGEDPPENSPAEAVARELRRALAGMNGARVPRRVYRREPGQWIVLLPDGSGWAFDTWREAMKNALVVGHYR